MQPLKLYSPQQWKRLIPLPGPGTYRFLAQGDSWFSIGTVPPTGTTNLLMNMAFEFPACAVNFAQPGAEAAQMVAPTTSWVFNPLFQAMLAGGSLAYAWDAILMSAGGNDLIAAVTTPPIDASGAPVTRDKRLLLLPAEWGPQSDVSRFCSDEGWQTFATHLAAVFSEIVAMRDDPKSQSQGKPLFLHSYAYPQPRDAGAGPLGNDKWAAGPWLYKAVGIYDIPNDSQQWLALARHLIDKLFGLLTQIAATHSNVHIVDFRGVLPPADPKAQGPSGDWANEIHPTTPGYQMLAPDYCAVVSTVVVPSAGVSAPVLAASPVQPGVLAASTGTARDAGASTNV